ncbi:uncharacterized protein LOC133337112 [Musca vetustissima]|uniref:uncharacterized protein LOC133337112 n=1 Tax=Musca vetustissima TaxID=27455 RepID=UPI002AB626E6|nr:uncharacterized protein LOC133337112 [Musca vetustissima]
MVKPNGLVLGWLFILHLIFVVSQKDNLVVELESFEIDKKYDTQFVDWHSLRMTRISRNNFVINGTAIGNMDLDNRQALNLQIFTYDAKQKLRGLLVFNVEHRVCDFIEQDKDVYPRLQEVSNLPEPGTCPLAKGQYHFKNYEINQNYLPADVPDGYYNILAKLKNGISTVAALEILIKISHQN